jgi:hypothetical protein
MQFMIIALRRSLLEQTAVIVLNMYTHFVFSYESLYHTTRILFFRDVETMKRLNDFRKFYFPIPDVFRD